MTFIWATRGKHWGFRFLAIGGSPDPLVEYDEAFAVIGERPQAFRRFDGKVALRFLDPESRKDRSGRVIPHEFVIDGQLATEINSFEEGCEKIWPKVADRFDEVWELPNPPSTNDE